MLFPQAKGDQWPHHKHEWKNLRYNSRAVLHEPQRPPSPTYFQSLFRQMEYRYSIQSIFRPSILHRRTGTRALFHRCSLTVFAVIASSSRILFTIPRMQFPHLRARIHSCLRRGLRTHVRYPVFAKLTH